MPSYQIALRDQKFKSRTFDIYIEFGNDYTRSPIQARLIKLGQLTIGHDTADTQIILLPGSLKITIMIDTYSEYVTLCRYISTLNPEDITIKLKENGANFFLAQVSRIEDIHLEDHYRKIEFNFIDDYSKLNLKNDIPWNPGHITIYDAIKELLENDSLSVESRIDFKYDYVETVDEFGEPTSIAEGTPLIFGLPMDKIFSQNYFGTRGEALKSLFHNLGCMGVINFNQQMLLVPQYYNGGRIVKITRKNTKHGELKHTYAKKYRGMVVYTYKEDDTWDKDDTSYGTVEYEEDDPEQYKYPDDIYEVRLFGSIDMLEAFESGYCRFSKAWLEGIGWKDIIANSASYKIFQGSYSDKGSLRDHFMQLLWNRLSVSPPKYVGKIQSTYYDYSTFFRLDTSKYIFKPLKLVYDFDEESTEVTLVEDRTYEFPTSFDDSIMSETSIVEE